MKLINIFIASSIEEFELDRVFIGNFIRGLNVNNRNCRIKLFLCEDASTNMQSLYDRQIQNCAIFIALVGEKLGPYTLHELLEAKTSQAIQERAIILKSKLSSSLIQEDILPYFTIVQSQGRNILETAYSYISNVVNKVKPIATHTITKQPSANFIINFPIINSCIEEAAIGNVIRHLNDQYEGIIDILVDSTAQDTCNAYVSIISGRDNYQLDRLIYISNLPIEHTKKWLFVNGHCLLSQQYTNLLSTIASRDGIYPSMFHSHVDLSLKFKDIVNSILIEYKVLEGFTYTIEDHILKRVSFVSGKKFVVKNLGVLGLDSDHQARKERTIKNILNMYCLTRNFEKLNTALSAINQENFDFFTYKNDEPLIGADDPYTAHVDYIIDFIERLFHNVEAISNSEIFDQLNNIWYHINHSDYRLRQVDSFKINYLCGCLLITCKVYSDITQNYFKQALVNYEDILYEDRSSTIFNTYKQCFLELCYIYYVNNKSHLLLDTAQKGLDIIRTSSEHDTVFEALMFMYMARSMVQKNRLNANQYYQEATTLIYENYNKDNYVLNLYIQIRYEYIINNILQDNLLYGNGVFNKEIDDLCKLYNKYLSLVEDDYALTEVFLGILVALKNNDISKCDQAIAALSKQISPDDNIFYDILYIKSCILENNTMYNEAIKLLEGLSKSCVGKRDQALCMQNIALCHMQRSLEFDSLCNAEKAFHKALSLYNIEDDPNLTGNIYDGLAYCYILKKEFNQAYEYSKKTIDISQYINCNKYSNYISALLCNKQYFKAWHTYRRYCYSDRLIIKERLLKDWEEMSLVGIQTKWFQLIFVV